MSIMAAAQQPAPKPAPTPTAPVERPATGDRLIVVAGGRVVGLVRLL
jgi:hypothetical protein